MGSEDQPQWRRAANSTLHGSLLLKALIEERLVDETGLLLADHEALINIADAEPPLRMTDIAHRLILSRGGVTKVIDRLEEMGHVQRLPDPSDRRATVVSITDAGRGAMAGTLAVVDQILLDTWGNVGDEESEVVIDVMRRVVGDRHEMERRDVNRR